MLVPCEIAVKCLLPAIRAMLAQELTTEHGLKQTETAKLLGVSQPAISLYYRRIRGKAINLEKDPEITKLIKEFANTMACGSESLSHKEFIQKFCEICKLIRSKGLMCELHKIFDPQIDIEKCELCLAIGDFNCFR
jgi:predicted transcriptional regulator